MQQGKCKYNYQNSDYREDNNERQLNRRQFFAFVVIVCVYDKHNGTAGKTENSASVCKQNNLNHYVEVVYICKLYEKVRLLSVQLKMYHGNDNR